LYVVGATRTIAAVGAKTETFSRRPSPEIEFRQ